MSEQPDRETLLKFAQSMEVNGLVISVSAKRTIKVGDDFQSFEAFESWTLGQTEGAFHFSVPPAYIQFASAHWTPKLIAKVLYTLYAGGVITFAEMKERIKESSRVFLQLTEPQDGKSNSPSDVRGTGESGSAAGSRPDDRPDLPEGQDGGVPSSAGPSEHSAGSGESGLLSSPSGSEVAEGSNIGNT